jgi:hypothetical protein
MKLDEAAALIKISDLSFLKEPHMQCLEALFEHAVDWLLQNPPGICCLDIRASPSFDNSLDASFFILDGRGDAAIARRPLRSMHFLERRFAGKQVAFNLMPLGSWCGANRFSFDWISRKPDGTKHVSLVYPGSVIDFPSLGLKLVNEFFVEENNSGKSKSTARL